MYFTIFTKNIKSIETFTIVTKADKLTSTS